MLGTFSMMTPTRFLPPGLTNVLKVMPNARKNTAMVGHATPAMGKKDFLFHVTAVNGIISHM